MHRDDTWSASLESSTINVTGEKLRGPRERIPALTLVAHPDLRRVGERLSLPALVSGRPVEISRLSPTFAASGSASQPRPVADPRISRKPLVLRPEAGGVIRLLRGEHPGEVLIDGIPLADEHALKAERLERGAVLELAGRVALLLHRVWPAGMGPGRDLGLIGASDAIAEVRREIERVAPLEVPVLLRGESGTGKELAARALHECGPRHGGPFVAVNMAAVPASLAAAELFGAERGAFTGAERRRAGNFRHAEGGTLFLDEVGAAPSEIQDLLLRALETREVTPVGSDTPRRVDVRLVAATDADLESALLDGRFRLPLLHRLSGWVIRLPPLRERRDDIARLLLHFLRRELGDLSATGRLRDVGPQGSPWLSASLLARLVAAQWPGNVRQLRNVARQLAVGSHDAEQAVLPSHLFKERIPAPASTSSPLPTSSSGAPPAADGDAPKREAPRVVYRSPGDVSDEELLEALRAHRFRLKPAAATLGVSRGSLYALIERCPKVRKASDLEAEEIEASLKVAKGDVDVAAARLEVSTHGLLLRLRELGLKTVERG